MANDDTRLGYDEWVTSQQQHTGWRKPGTKVKNFWFDAQEDISDLNAEGEEEDPRYAT